MTKYDYVPVLREIPDEAYDLDVEVEDERDDQFAPEHW